MTRILDDNLIQVAGIIDEDESTMLTECGVNYLGFPLRLPVNKEDLSEDYAKHIIANLKSDVNGVIISYTSTALETIELCNKLNCGIIQLHGPITLKELEKIKQLRDDLILFKSLVIEENNEEYLQQILKQFEPLIDAFITDTYNPITGASGATGLIHDWNISKRLVELTKTPIILAGGLKPDNVYEAIKFVKPYGVDVHTGVEDSTGRKNKKLVSKFVSESLKAFDEINNEN